jgi:hypothetical protein
MVGMRRAQQSLMRILAIAFSLSLIGCIDDTAVEPDPEDQLDDLDPSNDKDTGDNLPTDNKCEGENNLPGGTDSVSRKKADGSCF